MNAARRWPSPDADQRQPAEITAEERHGGVVLMVARQRVTRWVWLRPEELAEAIAALEAHVPPDGA